MESACCSSLSGSDPWCDNLIWIDTCVVLFGRPEVLLWEFSQYHWKLPQSSTCLDKNMRRKREFRKIILNLIFLYKDKEDVQTMWKKAEWKLGELRNCVKCFGAKHGKPNADVFLSSKEKVVLVRFEWSMRNDWVHHAKVTFRCTLYNDWEYAGLMLSEWRKWVIVSCQSLYWITLRSKENGL